MRATVFEPFDCFVLEYHWMKLNSQQARLYQGGLPAMQISVNWWIRANSLSDDF
jgi:hypothetical protein